MYDAETMSGSPSPSMSATYTDLAPSAEVVMSAAVHVGLAAPSFSYHAMVSSACEAETMSRSPSPSMSATYTESAPSAEVAISAAVHAGFAMNKFEVDCPVSYSKVMLVMASSMRSSAPSTLGVSCRLRLESHTVVW